MVSRRSITMSRTQRNSSYEAGSRACYPPLGDQACGSTLFAVTRTLPTRQGERGPWAASTGLAAFQASGPRGGIAMGSRLSRQTIAH